MVGGPASFGQKAVSILARLLAWFLDGSDFATWGGQKVMVRNRATGHVLFDDTSDDRRMEKILRHDLDRMSVGEFLDQWGLEDRGST
jgi:hypothetical protein